MADVSAPNPLRKYAVQKPKGKKWETLALLDDLDHGRSEFRTAVATHGSGYVRLIQIDFQSVDALSDYDWHLIEMHDPNGGKGGRPKPTVIAGTERGSTARRGDPQPRKGKAGGGGRGPNGGPNGGVNGGLNGAAKPKAPPPAQKAPFGPTRPPPPRAGRAGEKVPLPYATYVGAALFGALAVALWILWFRV